jgi:hypothetical protein
MGTQIAGSYDGASVNVYVNGQLVASTPSTVALASPNTAYKIGYGSHTGEAAYFNGRLDEVAIFESALEADELIKLYNDNHPKPICNTSPIINPAPVNQNNLEGAVIALPVVVGDFDIDPDNPSLPGDILTYTATGLPAGLIIDTTGVITGTISYEAGVGSPYNVTVKATDDGWFPLFHEKTFTWTVTMVNQAPTITTSLVNRTDPEGAAIALDVDATDLDAGDSLTYSATGLPSGLIINATSGAIGGSLSDEASAGSPYTVKIRATDYGLPSPLFDEKTFTWTVTDNANRAPTITTSLVNRTDLEGTAIALDVDATDPDVGDTLTYSATGLPSGLTINTTSGVIIGSISDGAAAGSPYTVKVKVTDNGLPSPLSVEKTFIWTVRDNHSPKLTNPGNQFNLEGDFVSLQIAASDLDSADTLTFSAMGLPNGLSIDATTGLINGTIPSKNAMGFYSVTINVTDGGETDQVKFYWEIGYHIFVPLLRR